MALIAAKEENGEGYSRLMPIRVFNSAALRQAREVFDDYKLRGVIVAGEYSDMSWTLSNETRNVGLALLTFDGGNNKTAMEWIGCTYSQYVMYVKAYIVFNFGDLGLWTLQDLTRRFNLLANATAGDTARMLDYAPHIVAFLQLIPGGNEQRDSVIDELEERLEQRKWDRRQGSPRRLADFRSYLLFHEVLTDFWRGADEPQKLFYFPLYFWWNLTAILPLRPIEFLLTPRNCLHTHNGEYMLTIRRTKLKGGYEKIAYRIADDYETDEYAINDHLAIELQWYMRVTDGMDPTELNTLLLQKPHFAYFGRAGMSLNRYYTYAMLKMCLKCFYQDVVLAKEYNIPKIRLGDTRHIAMTNLILSGGSPVICRELAGHAHIDISSHYYANISNLVECVTRERFRKSKGSEAKIHGGSKYAVKVPAQARVVSGGRCTSESFLEGRVDDCLKVSDNDGHVGDCRCCGYFLPDDPGVIVKFYDTADAKEEVDADSRYLIHMIELVRKGLGHTEDIASALLRLQHSGDHYGKCLWEKYSREGNA